MKDSICMTTHYGIIDPKQMFTKEDILRILAVITLDFLPDDYSPEVLETWLNESIESLERMKRLSYSD